MGRNPSPQGWGTPPSQFIQRPQSAPFILSLPSQEAQPRSSRGGATSRLISLMIFQQNHTLPLAATWPDLQPRHCLNVSRHTPEVCSGKPILGPKTKGWSHMPLSQVVSPSFICSPPCRSLACRVPPYTGGSLLRVGSGKRGTPGVSSQPWSKIVSGFPGPSVLGQQHLAPLAEPCHRPHPTLHPTLGPPAALEAA